MTSSFPVFSDELLLEQARHLPAAPRLLADLHQLIRAESTSIAEIVSLIRRDTALASRVLQTANSSFFAPSQPVAVIEDAVLTIGFREVHRLVGAVAATQLGDQPLVRHGITSARYRGNALFVATLMEALGEPAGLDARECYTVGLLRPIGHVVLERVAEAQRLAIPVFAPERGDLLVEWQRQHWGVECWSVAASILRHWHLPPEIALALEHHAHPELRSEPIVHLLHVASAIAARDGYGLPGEYPVATASAIAAAGLTLAQFEDAMDRAEETFKRLRSSIV